MTISGDEGRGERGERREERGEGKTNKPNPQMTDTNTDYTSAWDNYRRRRRWLFGVWLGGFVALAGLAKLLHTGPIQNYEVSINQLFLGVAISVWFIASTIAGVRLLLFRCPRCGRHFFVMWWRGDMFARRCLHCKLRKWAKNGSPEEDL